MKKANPRLIAIIYSNAQKRNQLCLALQSFYSLMGLSDTKNAIEALHNNIPALIIVHDEVRPDKSLDFIGKMRQEKILKNTPILYIAPAEGTKGDEALAAGASFILPNSFSMADLIQTISNALNANIEKQWNNLEVNPREALQQSVATFREISNVLLTGEPISFARVKKSSRPLVDAIENNEFKSILNAVKDHDDYTYAHSMRVATLLCLLGHAAGFKQSEKLLLSSGGLLHDVGKMMIPHDILNKPGKLTDEEFEVIKTHVPHTMDYLKTLGNIPQGVFIIAEQHHEKIDGTGYPHGLKGSQLNELARMAAVVDVFSALTDRRIYKPSMAATKAIGIMSDDMTKHLDQRYVSLFKSLIGDSGLLEESHDLDS